MIHLKLAWVANDDLCGKKCVVETFFEVYEHQYTCRQNLAIFR